MTTLHLKYSTLKFILDANDCKDKVVFIKKRNVSNILTFIPSDLCIIINTYDYEELVLDCDIFNYNDGDYDMDLTLDDNTIIFTIERSTKSFSIHIEDSKIVQILGGNINHKVFINAFMKHQYIKCKYSDDLKISYIKDDPHLMNSIIITRNDAISAIKILNNKQFKYMCIIIKCLINAINKYQKRKLSKK